MNYKEWADEYYREAEKILGIINALKSKSKTANAEQRQFLYSKISKYREMYNDCIAAANVLAQRDGGMSNAA